MTFNTIAQAFNHYMNHTPAEIERRALEIGQTIDTDPNADMDALNVELEGLRQAKQNAEQRSGMAAHAQLNPVTGASFERRASAEATDGDVLNSAEYRSAFFKKLLGQKCSGFEEAAYNRAQAEQRADAFSTVTDAAAVLPTATLNEVITKARTMGGLMSVCRAFNMPTKISVPVGTPASKASWHAEGARVEAEKPSVAAVSFNGYEILKVFSISAAAKRMSIAAFESYIVDELVNCVMACISDALVNGTGSGQGTGLLSGIAWGAVNMHTFAAEVGMTYADTVATVGKLARGYAGGAKWVMNNATLYNQFYGMVDANGRPVFITDPIAESIGKLLGFDVVVDDNLPDDEIIFGNFGYMAYNLAEGIAVEVSRESSFKSGLIDYRAMAIADCKPIVPEAFVKLCPAA